MISEYTVYRAQYYVDNVHEKFGCPMDILAVQNCPFVWVLDFIWLYTIP